jgi:hypothetical protein
MNITHMSKINKALLGLVVILLVALAGVVYWQKGGFEEKYSAVYLNTGDIYFGKLSRFPRMTLRDVWFLQKGSDEKQGFGLSKFEKAFWGPEDEMVISGENVIWVTELKADSEVVKTIKNPQIAASAQAGATASQQSAPTDEKSAKDEKNAAQ